MTQRDKDINAKVQRIKRRKEYSLSLRLFILCTFALTGCTKPASSEQPKDLVAKLKTCLPEYKKNSINNYADNILKIKNVMSDYQSTTLTINIVASDKPLDFNLPMYVYSKGRWLINPDNVNGKDGEKGRVYLTDVNCNQYKLKDRGSSKDIDKNGKLRLKAGQTFETTLTFTPLPTESQVFLLMYGEQILIFEAKKGSRQSAIVKRKESQ